jgi:hypothetical protein
MELKVNATLVNHALVDKSSINQPTYAILDHLLLVDVSKRDLQMDTLVYNAHSTKLLIQTIQMNVLHNSNALVFKSDSQETTKTVEDAKTAISQFRFQTMSKLDALLDQSQPAHAFREVLIKATHVLIAFQVKSLISQIQTEIPVSPQHHAWDHNKSLLLLTESVVVDARLANSQDKLQMSQGLDVLIDHQLFVVASRDNPLTDTHVSHALKDKLFSKTIQSNAIDQLAQEPAKYNQQLTNSIVEDVKLANSQLSFQTLEELLVSQDHQLFAILAPLDSQMMDTHALLAHQERFNTRLPHMMLKVT